MCDLNFVKTFSKLKKKQQELNYKYIKYTENIGHQPTINMYVYTMTMHNRTSPTIR